jgi:glycosidase
MRYKLLLAALIFASNLFSQIFDSPEWTKNLIIYEIATKGFTSPNGPESGTFNSLKAKIPYLADLGINGIWLTGHQLCASRFFYHCWNQYAVIRPDSIDPSLGTEADFKSLIDEFHKNGIKVFLDVETHGVMPYSSLAKQHPDFFKGGSWGMIDYDWFGEKKELDSWWVKMYTDYVLKFGVDGYRLDVDIYRPDLWKQIKVNCKKAGHPIVAWLESDNYSGGACDFLQRQATLSVQTVGLDTNSILSKNIGQYFNERYNRSSYYQVEAHYADGSIQNGFTDYDPKRVYYSQFQYPLDPKYKDSMLKVTLLFEPNLSASNEKYKVEDESKYIQLKIENLNPDKRITYFSIKGCGYWNVNWQWGSPNEWSVRMSGNKDLVLYLKPFVPDIKYYSIQLSSHDEGWDGFPANANPYVAEGSRCAFGYSCMFTPAIPLFFSGEEFNDDYKPVPSLAADLYGKKAEGTGKWLYGSWLQWDQLKQKQHAAMLTDVKKMISIRKQNSDIFVAWTDNKMPNISALEYTSSAKIPVPYIIWCDKKAIIIAGNNTDKDIQCTVTVPVDKISLKKITKCNDLWNGGSLKLNSNSISFTIRKDKTPGGGIAVIKLE